MADSAEDLARRLSTTVSRAISEALANQSIPSASASTNSNSSLLSQRQQTLATTPTQALASRFPLPSVVCRDTFQVPPKRRRITTSRKKIYCKTALCLPPQNGRSDAYPIPRGESRASLQQAGLVGKVSIDSSWSAQMVTKEISSLFGPCFGVVDAEILPFDYLTTLTGTKKLCHPKTSSSFVWDATQVLSICSRDCLYIMSKVEPLRSLLQNTNKSENEDDFDDSIFYLSVFDNEQEEIKKPDCEQPVTDPASKDNSSLESNIAQPVEEPSQRDIFRSYSSLVYNNEIDLVSDGEEDGVGDNVSSGETASTCNNKTLSEILLELQSSLEENETTLINVRRGAIWTDTCRQMTRKRFSPRRNISVKFADSEGNSEGAVDVGGPKREFLRLAVRAANLDSGVFIGPEGCRTLYANSIARDKDAYRLVGTILAWSVVHGGPGGNFFSPSLYNSIVYGPAAKCHLEDVPDSQLRRKVGQVFNSSTLAELRDHLNDEKTQPILNDIGACATPLALEKRDWYGKVLLRHILVDSTKYLLEELMEGLNTLSVLDAMKAHPEKLRDLFTKENIAPLDAETVDLLFSIEYAEQGSNARAKQEMAVVFWRDYLQDCESRDAQASLQDVLIFVTGAQVPPTLGFDTQPKISFVDEAFPSANTCATTLRLPTIYETYEEFKEKMDYAILNSPCFGQA